MNPSKEAQLLSTLNALARKVYQALSADEGWTAGRVCRELVALKLTGNPQHSAVMGCLAQLHRIGLAHRVDKETFMKVRVSTTPLRPILSVSSPTPAPAPILEESPGETKVATPPAPQPKAEEFSPIQRITAISVKLKECIKELEDVALDVEEGIQKMRTKYAKLEAPRGLLKGLDE